jgi:hypothetical protein
MARIALTTKSSIFSRCKSLKGPEISNLPLSYLNVWIERQHLQDHDHHRYQ